MSSLLELRQTIDSARDMQSIVTVMKTLSMVSINQYQRAAGRMRTYQQVVDGSLNAVLTSGAVTIEEGPDESAQTGLVVFGSEQGLCGRFNEVMVERAGAWLRRRDGSTPLLAIGERGATRLEAEGFRTERVLSGPGSVAGLSRLAETILLQIDDWRGRYAIERVEIIYNIEAEHGGIAARQETLLPLERAELERIAGRQWPSNQIPAFNGRAEDVFPALVRERFYTTLMRAGAESLAAEHATRLSAMQGAEKNIAEKIADLEDRYRHARQDAITEELMDIVSAYQSVTGAGDP